MTSAYPSILEKLPAPSIPIDWIIPTDPKKKPRVKRRRNGTWTYRYPDELSRERIAKMSVYSMIEIEFTFPEATFDEDLNRFRPIPWYPLPYRRAKDRAILFPRGGIGRYMRDEVLAAYEWLDVMAKKMNKLEKKRAIVIRGAMEFVPPVLQKDDHELTMQLVETACLRPASEFIGKELPIFAFERTYYERRAEINALAKKNAKMRSADMARAAGLEEPTKDMKDKAAAEAYDCREKVLKLGINSAYGKLAQGVGGSKHAAPSTSFPWAAAATTAGTRALLVRAGLRAPHEIIFFATDGIQSLKPLGIESEQKILGTWEYKKLIAGVFIAPGVYAFHDEKEYTGKSRGVGIKAILGPVENYKKEYYDWLCKVMTEAWIAREKEIVTPREALLTFGAASATRDKWPMVGSWIETTRAIACDNPGVKHFAPNDPALLKERIERTLELGVTPNTTPNEMSAMHVPGWLNVEMEIARMTEEDNRDIAMARGMFGE